jgi:tetratricopeptide (TPR) repeat protein
MANTYHQLGILAWARGEYDEAARQYQRALDIFERLGDQATWHAPTASWAAWKPNNLMAQPPRPLAGM